MPLHRLTRAVLFTAYTALYVALYTLAAYDAVDSAAYSATHM